MGTANPLDYQIGGDHYCRLPVQPIEFAMANELDAAAFSILKYLTRHRTRAGVNDLNKAVHFQALRETLMDERHAHTRHWTITPELYCGANGITGADRQAILTLCRWVADQNPATSRTLYACFVVLLAEYDVELDGPTTSQQEG